MKLSFALLIVCLFSSHFYASEIVNVKLFDGETLTGKLDLPANGENIKELVIFIHGTGPGTYQEHRKIGSTEFNYFDFFVEEFNKRGVAFFVYNKRGVEIGDQPPFYDKVDKEKYKKVLPSIEVKDIAEVIKFLKKDKRLKNAKVVLLGWSEGTIVASMVADDKKNNVDALFLAGYANENLFEVIKWQNSGASSIINIRKYFDKNGDNIISKEEYDSDEKSATSMRTQGFGNAKFEQIDVNKDNVINSEDFRKLNEVRYKTILSKIEAGDDDWIWNNYFRVTTAWLKEHFQLEANKTRLLRVSIPIYIFHGEDDSNCDVAGVYDLKDRFAKNNRTNLHYFVFKGEDHNLNYANWAIRKVMSDGIKKIFEISEELNGKADKK